MRLDNWAISYCVQAMHIRKLSDICLPRVSMFQETASPRTYILLSYHALNSKFQKVRCNTF